ncbi:MAG: hypothetical protein JRI23_07820 [Deltaproteobacteria bacterium]|nr:hypothetical protein [Deltaproteobacteria bacterium]MBW2531513.1 hypothetical protein [Deltaproteobacteria bacterium]
MSPFFRRQLWVATTCAAIASPAVARPPTEPGAEDARDLPCPPGAYCERAPWDAAGGGPAAEPTWSLDPSAPPPEAERRDLDGQDSTEQRRRRTRRYPYPLSTKPDRIPYETGDPIPPGYRREKDADDTLFLAGAGVLGLSYLPWLAIGLLSLESDDPTLAYVAIPLVGPPLLALQYDLSSAVTTVLIVNGAVQGLGIALMIAAELAGESYLVRDARTSTPKLAPWAARDSLGAQLYGAF